SKIDDHMRKVREQAESKIYTELQKAYPKHEFAFPGLVVKHTADTIWQIDVLSGEANFRHGVPHFAITIAIRENKKVQHCLVYNPLLQELFTATRGEQTNINNKRVRVSTTKTLENALLATNYNLAHAPVRQTGCPALELAYVAAGRYDGFIGKDLTVYEIAAGSLLVKTAGGLFGDFMGDTKCEETGELVAGNTKLFKELLQIV
ncbi:MAG: inositol monophosphatase, partial [Gammaproteobacteria bacterium]|nr:inositol monophosphatase [Gammaproteobacteria bacterium]